MTSLRVSMSIGGKGREARTERHGPGALCGDERVNQTELFHLLLLLAVAGWEALKSVASQVR